MAIRPHPQIALRAKEPRYSFAEAGRLIGRQPATLRRWGLGHDRVYRDEPRHDPALIRVDGEQEAEYPLSFLNLIELRFLASWRQSIPLPTIRVALAYAATELGVERPLLEVDFKRHGKELFFKYGEQLVSASRGGQLSWPEAADTLLASLDYDTAEQAAYRWWPLGRERPVLLDTRLNGGRPTTSASAVRTVAIATRLRDGWDFAEITDDTSASADEIRAAAKVEGIKLAS